MIFHFHRWKTVSHDPHYFTDVVSGKPVHKIHRVCTKCWKKERFMTDSPGLGIFAFRVECVQ